MVRQTKPYGLMNHIPEGYMTRGQAAAVIGKSKDTLRRWHETGRFITRHKVKRGERYVWLYDADDLEALKTLVRTTRPGPVPRKKETA